MHSFSGKKKSEWSHKTWRRSSAFKKKLEFVEFLNSSFATGRYYMPSFSGKNIQNDPMKTEVGVAIWNKSW